MPLETGTYISDLDASWPLSGDPTNRGDDHLRTIKAFILNTFPNITGAVTVTHTEINSLLNITGNVQAQIDALVASVAALTGVLSAEVGTKMPFYQAAAPTGWTQDVTKSDHMMRVIATAGGGSGGTDSPLLNDKVPSHTHVASVVDPGHVHDTHFNNNNGVDADGLGAGSRNVGLATGFDTGSKVTGISVTNAANAGAANWAPKYIDLIIASKD